MSFTPWDKWIKKVSDKVLFFYGARKATWTRDLAKWVLTAFFAPVFAVILGSSLPHSQKRSLKFFRRITKMSRKQNIKISVDFSWGQNKTEQAFISATVPTFWHHLSKNARKIGQLSTQSDSIIDGNFSLELENFPSGRLRSQKAIYCRLFSVILSHTLQNEFIHINFKYFSAYLERRSFSAFYVNNWLKLLLISYGTFCVSENFPFTEQY